MKSRFLVLAALLISIAVLQLSAGDKGKGNLNPGVIPPQANYQGKSYGEWSAEWSRWCFSLPVDGHPLFEGDPTAGQSGKVWFLGGKWWANDTDPVPGPVVRKLTMPPGTALFFPIVNGENNFVEALPEVTTLEELWATQAWVNDYGNDNLYVIIDGKPLHNLTDYLAVSPVFDMWVPEGNILEEWGCDFESGLVDPVVAAGYFVMLAPLPVGKHTVKFGVMDVGWSMDIEYEITVVPAGKAK